MNTSSAVTLDFATYKALTTLLATQPDATPLALAPVLRELLASADGQSELPVAEQLQHGIRFAQWAVNADNVDEVAQLVRVYAALSALTHVLQHLTTTAVTLHRKASGERSPSDNLLRDLFDTPSPGGTIS